MIDHSADFWALQLHEYKDGEQKKYCFNKIHEAVKQISSLELATKEQQLLDSINKELEQQENTPENVIRLF